MLMYNAFPCYDPESSQVVIAADWGSAAASRNKMVVCLQQNAAEELGKTDLTKLLPGEHYTEKFYDEFNERLRRIQSLFSSLPVAPRFLPLARDPG